MNVTKNKVFVSAINFPLANKIQSGLRHSAALEIPEEGEDNGDSHFSRAYCNNTRNGGLKLKEG